MAEEQKREVLVEVKNLEVTYGSGRKAYKAVSNANFTIYKGETFGLVGESGCGKSITTLAIMGLTEAGMQPFELDGDMVVCNGELYGFRPLKRQLTERELLADRRGGEMTLYASDRPEDFGALAGMFLGQPLQGAVRPVDIEKY